ncbi:hypothetical protein BGZ98_000026 [Dissophora globulifera]|nr:hypothetical protein BGZ98_000026 [Dissophora globulifera]
MQSTAKSFSSPGSVAASIDSLASVPGIRDVSAAVAHVNETLAQGSLPSANSTSASSLSSSGSLPINQQHGHIHQAQDIDLTMHSASAGSRSQIQNHSPSWSHSRNHSSNSHQSLAMTSRTPSESNSHLTLPSPSTQQPSYPLPPQFLAQPSQLPSPTSQSVSPHQLKFLQQQQQQQQPPSSLPLQQQQQPQQLMKPKKDKHTFAGTASSFLTDTLPTGIKLYPGSKKGAKSHGDISSSHSINTHTGKGKKSGSGGALSSINTRKQQLSPGGHSSSAVDRAYSSTSSIASPTAGGPHHHYITSPILTGKNHHSSLDAKVMAREMAQGHATEDVWQALCIKVLTLFNGQGLTGAIEDLNELVRRCLYTRTALALCDEINELLKNGMLTLNAKLGDVPDEKLVSRLVEVWSFFFGTVLPYFEGVFLPLQIELKAYRVKKETRRTTGSNSSGGPSSGALTLSYSYGGGSGGGLSTLGSGSTEAISASPKSTVSDVDRNHEDPEPENVRTMALTGFRDLVILPMVGRLGGVFAKLFVDFDVSIPVTDTASRMFQMTSVLTSIQSADAQQLLMEQVSRELKMNWKQFTRRGNRGGFVGLERRIAPAQQAR